MKVQFLCVLVAVASCKGKGDEQGKPTVGSTDKGSAAATGSGSGAGTGSGTSPAAGSATAATPPPAPGITYPPPGDGPHAGVDLAAIRTKLQGTWLLGPGTPPSVWHVQGDDLVQYDTTGKKTEHTIELLAPCYARVADKGASSATYWNFVFDGDTLYAGLGNAGVTTGDTTIGCVSSGIYVLKGETCTGWAMDTFADRAKRWTTEAGTCSMVDGVFTADDATAKRPLYGKQVLDQKVGSVLMTRQMTGNKAEKVASLDVALATQREAIAAADALTKLPADLPFYAWGLPAETVAGEANARVFAAGVDRDGAWSLRSYRIKEIAEKAVWLTGMKDVFAPPAFVLQGASVIAPVVGAPAVVFTGMELWGLIDKVEGDQVTVRFLSGPAPTTRTSKADEVLVLPTGKIGFGSPVIVDGKEGIAVRAEGDQTYVLAETGGKLVVAPQPTANVKLIDGSKRHKVGAKVLVKQSSGMGSLSWVPGKVTKVIGNGVAYEVKTDEGKIETQVWARVTGA